MQFSRSLEPHSLPPSFLHTPAPPTVVTELSFKRQPPHLPVPATSPPQQQLREGRGREEGGAAVAHGGHPFSAGGASLLAGSLLAGSLCWRGFCWRGLSAGGVSAGGVSLLAGSLLAGSLLAGSLCWRGLSTGGVSLLAGSLLAGSLWWRGLCWQAGAGAADGVRRVGRAADGLQAERDLTVCGERAAAEEGARVLVRLPVRWRSSLVCRSHSLPPFPPQRSAATPFPISLSTAFRRHSLPLFPLLPTAAPVAHASSRDGGGDGQGAGGMRRAKRRRAKERLGRQKAGRRTEGAYANALVGCW
ncbi:unnamed protein product [Closterium sp. NIES-64]|nr:unnamed protein product [Closterium sp. NIES-64]